MPPVILLGVVKKMTPAQYKAAVQKAQRDQKRAIDNYNREARKYNASVTRAVDNYNRQVRNYNSKARAHNREVESQRRRVRQEIARLNSRPASTSFSAVRTSAQSFAGVYEAVETHFESAAMSPADRRFLDAASEDVANSAYLANALDGDGEPEDDPTEDDLRSPSMTSELGVFGDDVVSRWTGALFALSPLNPDAARHFCTSAREVLVAVLDNSAPDVEVKENYPTFELTEKGAVTRRSKIAYLLHRQGVTSEKITTLVSEDVDNVLALFRTFNDGTHGHAGRYTITELSAIRTRVESAVRFMHEIVTKPA